MTRPAASRPAVRILCPPGPLRGRLVGGLAPETPSVGESVHHDGGTEADDPGLIVLAAPPGSPAPAEQVAECLRRWPEADVIVVCDPEGDARSAPERLLRAGAAGLVALPELERTLPATVTAVRAGQACVPRRLRAGLAPPSLSRRERQALGLVVMGMSNGEIAAQLHLTESTVKSHLTGAYRKLGVASRAEAIDRLLDPVAGLGAGILTVAGSSS